jgi:hypothetical protein
VSGPGSGEDNVAESAQLARRDVWLIAGQLDETRRLDVSVYAGLRAIDCYDFQPVRWHS